MVNDPLSALRRADPAAGLGSWDTSEEGQRARAALLRALDEEVPQEATARSARTNRPFVVILAFVATLVILVPVAFLTLQRDSPPQADVGAVPSQTEPVPTSGIAMSASPGPAVVGAPSESGDDTPAAVASTAATLPDGRAVVLTHPEGVALSTAELRGSIAGRLLGGAWQGCGALFEMSVGDGSRLTRDSDPVAAYATRNNGIAELWNAARSTPAGQYLIFSAGEWNAAIPFALNDACPASELAAIWADSAVLSVVDGWLVVEFVGDAAVDMRAVGGPSVEFVLGADGNSLEVSGRDCDPLASDRTPEPRDDRYILVACHDTLSLVLTAIGDLTHVQAAAHIELSIADSD